MWAYQVSSCVHFHTVETVPCVQHRTENELRCPPRGIDTSSICLYMEMHRHDQNMQRYVPFRLACNLLGTNDEISIWIFDLRSIWADLTRNDGGGSNYYCH
jgi:hypothetical protein